MPNYLLLVGAGPMAMAYAKVLQALKKTFLVSGRGRFSAAHFERQLNIPVVRGGIEKSLQKISPLPQKAIVVVGERDLGRITRHLLRSGIKEILVEKPGGYHASDIQKVALMAKLKKAKVFVAYNRRFYSSVARAREMIREDGGVLSFSFEFTELSQIVSKLKKTDGVKKEWFLANSTHVIDLAFFLGGKPRKIIAFAKTRLPWGPKVSIFAGAGISQSHALFSYSANWIAPGRWGIEVLTKKRRLILRPLEKLLIQKLGSLEIQEARLNDSLDHKYKPGLYREVLAFLGNKKNLPTIQDQVAMLPYYQLINRRAT